MNEGTVIITRITSNMRPDCIRITLSDDKARSLASFELTPEQFALALTGKSDVPCEWRVFPHNLKQQEA